MGIQLEVKDRLEQLCPGRVLCPSSVYDIPREKFMVYILALDGVAVVVGHGKRNRAQVIFDSAERITPNHIKALPVRLYSLFGSKKVAQRFIVLCRDKDEAKSIEADLHQEIGGNSLQLPQEIHDKLFKGIEIGSLLEFILRASLSSSFDGIADLRKWRREGLIPDNLWVQIGDQLDLPEDMRMTAPSSK